MPGLDGLTRLFRGRARPGPEELEWYSGAAAPMVEQLGALFRRWHDDLELDAPDDDLANSASIRRWEAAGLRDRAAAVEPPASLAREHEELVWLAGSTARAAQLLSNGYRFHSSSARCDGQSLMMAAQERHATLHRHLELLGVSFPADADADAARRR